MTTSISPAGRRLPPAFVFALGCFLTACVVTDKDKTPDQQSSATGTGAVAVMPFDTADITAPVFAVDTADTVGLAEQMADSAQSATTYKSITTQSANADLAKFPWKPSKGGPDALRVQVLLDRAGFSPGIIDGIWGKNARKALQFFASSQTGDVSGMDSTSTKDGSFATNGGSTSLDQPAYQRLVAAAGNQPAVVTYTLTDDDVKGPFVTMPSDVYEKAKLECLCYASAAEKIAEKFHSSERLLRQLNPGVDLAKVTAGTSITVPAVADSSAMASDQVAKLIISKTGYWLHAVDASGKLLYHFPSTLGAGYDPSPTGDFHVTGVAQNPTFHYQPTLFAEVPDSKPTARLAAGPNSPVGVVWMALSKPHYGIHGTESPQTIGYANSHGCVRLTNWDAERLSKMVKPGTPVVFQ